MSQTIAIEVEMPDEMPKLALPPGVAARLQFLLSKQDSGQSLTAEERHEAEGLVDMAEWLSLLKLRASRLGPQK